MLYCCLDEEINMCKTSVDIGLTSVDDGPWVTVRFQLQLPVPGTLPSFVRDEQSLAAFRRQLKTVLFRTCFGEDANT